MDIVAKFNYKCQFVVAGLILVIIWSEKGLDQMSSCSLHKRCHAEYPSYIAKEVTKLSFYLGKYIHVNKMEKCLWLLVIFLVFWTWCLILLHALLFSGEASCIQIPNRESNKMVTAGKHVFFSLFNSLANWEVNVCPFIS